MDNKDKSLFIEANETGDFYKYLENQNNALKELLVLAFKVADNLNLSAKFNKIK